MLIDLKPFAQTHTVLELLSHCLVENNSETLQSVADFYSHKEGLYLKGYTIREQIVGVIGYAFKSPRKAIITHLSVEPGFRGQGIATALINGIIETHRLKWVGAESTEDALSFYEHLNFQCVRKYNTDDNEGHYSCHLSIDNSRIAETSDAVFNL